MAYITKEQVAVIRNKLKEKFPAKQGWKFSVRLDGCSSVNVSVLKGPFEFERYKKDEYEGNLGYRRPENGVEAVTYMQTHYSWLREDNYPTETLKILTEIWAIVNFGNYDNSDIMTDYFDVGYYTDVSVGKYDVPYVKV